MPRIDPNPLDAIDPQVAESLDLVRRKMGMVPNVMRTAAHSRPAITLLLQTLFAFERSELDPAFRELATVAIAAANGCTYCRTAHTAIGKMMGLDDRQIASAAAGASEDPTTQAGLDFVLTLVAKRGRVDQNDFDAVRSTFNETQIVDMVALVAMHTLTNYLNAVAQTEIDTPFAEAA